MGEDTGTKGFFENSGNAIGWLNTAEAASYLRMSPNALRIAVHRGLIPARKLGRRLRFSRSEIDARLTLRANPARGQE